MRRFPNFATALRGRFVTYQAVMIAFGVSKRAALHYLAGNYVPRADKVAPYPDLVEAVLLDVRQPEAVAA